MESNWTWPEELDALTAAPKHHKLLYENEIVRVVDTSIAPGEITEVHTHKWPASLYVLRWSNFIRYDDGGNIMLDSRILPTSPSPSIVCTINPSNIKKD